MPGKTFDEMDFSNYEEEKKANDPDSPLDSNWDLYREFIAS